MLNPISVPESQNSNELTALDDSNAELNPWHQYQGWKIWNVPDSNLFVCVRENAGKVLEVDKTLPITKIVRTIELSLDDREKTPTSTWQQIRQIVAENRASFWANLLDAARNKSVDSEQLTVDSEQ